jgi:type IV pilus assembly protein PilZ
MPSSPPFSSTGNPGVSDSDRFGGKARPGVLQLHLETPMDLYYAYIPLFTDGGLFVQTSRAYQLGEQLFGLLTLPQDATGYPLVGQVAWITPANSPTGRPQGIGLRFAADGHGAVLKEKIETALGPLLASKHTNYTF